MAKPAAVAATAALLATLAAAQGVSKRGLVYNDDIPISQFGQPHNGLPSQINWAYNWDSTTNQQQPWAEFVPMLWGTQYYHTPQWQGNANYWIGRGTKHLLGFNEPDRPDQANMTAQDAVNGWRQYMEPFHGIAQLGAPAVSNGGYNWLTQFLQQCSGCHIDFIPVHWYNDYSIEFDLQDWVTKICNIAGGRPVWVTEFEGFGSNDQQGQFLSQAMPWLDNNPCVARYSYFGSADPDKSLLNNGGPALSPLGVQYAYSGFGKGRVGQ